MLRFKKMKQKIAFSVVLLTTVFQPLQIFANIDLTATSAVLMDETGKRVLYEKNGNKKMYPASTTKILTALLAAENLEMDKLYVVGREINGVPLDSSKAGHILNENILGINLIRGLIIPSGNDTACVVALAVAKKVSGNENLSYKEAEVIFADLMNKRSKEIGAASSHFVNPHGYHDEEHYTTGVDMSLISVEAMKNPIIAEIAKEKNFIGNGALGEAKEGIITQDYRWNSHNLLINSKEYSYPYATGLKTGFTNEAGNSVVASAAKDGERLIATVFQSKEPERWIDAKKMFEYGFENYDLIKILETERKMEEIPLLRARLGESQVLEVYPKNSFEGYYSQEEIAKIEYKITYLQDKVEKDETGVIKLKTPIQLGEVIGTVTCTLDGKVLKEEDVISKREVPSRGLKSDIKYYFDVAKKNAFSIQMIPYWIGAVVGIFGVTKILSWFHRKRSANNYRFRK